jgi:OOP family OmpA-OmpF porin
MTKTMFTNTLMALGALSLAACSSAQRAPLAAGTTPQEGIDKLSMELTSAQQNQYAQLDPSDYSKAMDARNSAKDMLSKGKDSSKILDKVAAGEHSIMEVNRVGEASKGTLGEALKARDYAVKAQAPKFAESDFKSAEKDLASLGSDIAKGKSVDADDVRKVEMEYSKAEIPARKRAELGSSYQMLDTAKSNGASGKTPILYNQAKTQIASAEHAIAMSPHDPSQYASAVGNAKATTQKLSDVLSIARQKNASEDVALTIYNQNQALIASRNELSNTKAQAAQELTAEQKAAQDKLTAAQAAADSEQAKLQGDIAQKDARINEQSETLVAVDAQNQKYADKAQMEAKIQELKEKISPNEAEVVKDGKNIVVRIKQMAFATGRSDLNPDSFSILQKVDGLIAAVPTEGVKVEGHTDSTGSVAKNKELSEKRAEAVKKYLLSQGLAENLKVETEGYGSEHPLKSNKTKEGRATNRRVDIIIQTPVVL